MRCNRNHCRHRPRSRNGTDANIDTTPIPARNCADNAWRCRNKHRQQASRRRLIPSTKRRAAETAIDKCLRACERRISRKPDLKNYECVEIHYLKQAWK
jgi:hypothetical protein